MILSIFTCLDWLLHYFPYFWIFTSRIYLLCASELQIFSHSDVYFWAAEIRCCCLFWRPHRLQIKTNQQPDVPITSSTVQKSLRSGTSASAACITFLLFLAVLSAQFILHLSPAVLLFPSCLLFFRSGLILSMAEC